MVPRLTQGVSGRQMPLPPRGSQRVVLAASAGQPYDPCYHLASDTLANNSNAALDEMGDAAAHTLLTFAHWNFAKSPLTNPETTAQPRGGGTAAARAEGCTTTTTRRSCPDIESGVGHRFDTWTTRHAGRLRPHMRRSSGVPELPRWR